MVKFSKEKEISIIQDYLSGIDTVTIGKKWNTWNTSIRRVLLRNNIPLRSNEEIQRTINECPFKIGDEYSEYFLGLLLTDGCITKGKQGNPAITLSLKDKELIENFRDFMCPKNKVSTVLQKKYNTYMYSTGAKSLIVANWLQQHGNFTNKSYDCDIYTPITPHILRGIFDGDGYWHSTNGGTTMAWGICGKSKIFLEKVQQYLLDNDIISSLNKRAKPNNNYLYYLEITKTVDTIKVANLMYKDAHIYLIRKYDKRYLFEETLREKLCKFREGDAYHNPEPSYNKLGKNINQANGRFIMEGAETIITYLSYPNWWG